jgi:CBS domain-containing protein
LHASPVEPTTRPNHARLLQQPLPPLRRIPASLAPWRTVIAQARTDLNGLVTWLERERRPVTGLTHNDIFEGNLLVHRGRVSAVLDWEEADIDWQVWDLASSLWPFCSDGDRLHQRAATEFFTAYRAAGGTVPSDEDDLIVPLIRARRILEVVRALTDRHPRWDLQQANLRAYTDLSGPHCSELADPRAACVRTKSVSRPPAHTGPARSHEVDIVNEPTTLHIDVAAGYTTPWALTQPAGRIEMASARDIMTGDAECVSVNDTLTDAARKLRDLQVGAMPICGDDNRLKGMLTDRDIVVKCIAVGGDPATTKVVELAEGKPVTIGADDSVEEALRTMKEHGVRRLPVIDGHELIGIVSQADVARNLPEDKIGDLVEAISSAPSNN